MTRTCARPLTRSFIFIPVVLLLLAAFPAIASDARPWRVSVVASDISNGKEPWESDTHAGTGVALAYTFRPNWDVELAAASIDYRQPYSYFVQTTLPSGVALFVPVTEYRKFTVRPIDLVATRHLGKSTQVYAPYVRAGVRYVQGPDSPNLPILQPIPPGFEGLVVLSGYGRGYEDRMSAQAGAGLLVHITPRTALRAEVNRLLRTKRSPFDPLTRAALGLTWTF